MLAEYIITAGHREVGVITVPENVNFAINERMRGIQEAFEDAGIRCDTERIAYSDFSTTGGADATTRLLERIPAITALVCINDRMAMGAIQRLNSLGKRVPDDITVVGYDNVVASQLVTPALTTVDHQAGVLGMEAARMLLAVMDGQAADSIILSPKLIVRDSSAQLRPAG
jgi:LacI family transcriptional regulator